MGGSAVPLAVVPVGAASGAPLLPRDGSALTGAAAAAEAADTAAALEAEKQDAELVPLFPDFPAATRATLRAFGKSTWKGLTDFSLFFSVFLMWHLVHQNTLVHANATGSDLQKCMIHSWSVTISAIAMLLLTIGIYAWRAMATSKLPTAVEQAVDIAGILFGIFISSCSGIANWQEQSPITELCSSVRNPVANNTQLLADFLGLGGLLRSILVVIANPYVCGNRTFGIAGSALTVLIVAITVQFTLLDLLLVPALATAVRNGEEAGDVLAWIDELLGYNSSANTDA